MSSTATLDISTAPGAPSVESLPMSPDGSMHEDTSLTSKTEDERLMQEALGVLMEAEEAQATAMLVAEPTSGTSLGNATDQSSDPTIPFVAASSSAPILKTSHEEYHIDLKELEAGKKALIQLEQDLYKARYTLQAKTEAFHAKYYPQGMEAAALSATKKMVKRRKRTVTTAWSTASLGSDVTEGNALPKMLTRGWNNYQVFRKLCKELLTTSCVMRRAFNQALWENQKQEMEVFFARHQVSPASCKAMADMNAYSKHITTTVKEAMEIEMPFYVQMIRLYDNKTSNAENLTRLSSMCALQTFAKLWSTDVESSQTLLMAVWTAFQGLLDLKCRALGIPALFPETIPEGSQTPPMTEARLKNEVAPKLAASMPFLVSLFQSYTSSMGVEEVHTLVQQARVAQSHNGGISHATV